MPDSYGLLVREAQPSDVKAIHALICELALYEKAQDEVITTPEILLKDGFGTEPAFIAWVAEWQGKVIGMALCYVRYSTWKGKVLYLEDLYVKEEYRRKGAGAALFEKVLEHTRLLGYERMCWQVLEWNTPAIQFYKKYGAILDPEWVNGILQTGKS